MQPLHYSAPSSSTTSLASKYITRYIHTLLASAGFSKSSSHAVQLLTEVFERYLLLLGSTAQHHSQHVGRNIPTVWDAEQALLDLGTCTEEIRTWIMEEGGDILGSWGPTYEHKVEDEDIPWQSFANNTLPNVPPFRRMGWGDASEKQILQYRDVGQSDMEELERLWRQELEKESTASSPSDSDGNTQATSPASPSNGEVMQVDRNEGLAHRKRKHTIEYIPDFLPDFPSRGHEPADDRISSGVIDDAEFEASVRQRVQQGQERSDLGMRGMKDDKTDDLRQLEIENKLQQELRRSVEDTWHNIIPFSTSNLASTQSVDDLPSIDENSDTAISHIADSNPQSSMRAFSLDYPTLVKEAQTSGSSMLTPSGLSYSRVFDQRRVLASLLADPSKYVPCDTLFGSISARPSVMPFQPTSSMLITPPTSSNPAPTFTPIRPNGREMPSTSTISLALYPACRHRNPGNVLNAARMLSGGPNTETFRRVTKIHDPIPIVDEQHAERVFHGQPASKELLNEGHSYLRAAVDVLNARHAHDRRKTTTDSSLVDERDSQPPESEPARQLNLSASRDRMKVKQGTIVATWDWTVRDHTDSVLPAKRFRAATPGVSLNGPTFHGEHQRSDSIAPTGPPTPHQRTDSGNQPN